LKKRSRPATEALAGIIRTATFLNQQATGFSHWQMAPERRDATVIAAVRRRRLLS
jgi:hypothetical protein